MNDVNQTLTPFGYSNTLFLEKNSQLESQKPEYIGEHSLKDSSLTS